MSVQGVWVRVKSTICTIDLPHKTQSRRRLRYGKTLSPTRPHGLTLYSTSQPLGMSSHRVSIFSCMISMSLSETSSYSSVERVLEGISDVAHWWTWDAHFMAISLELERAGEVENNLESRH